MTTTEHGVGTPRVAPSSVALRQYLLAALATIYLIAWFLFAARTPTKPAQPVSIESPTNAILVSSTPVAWWHELPPATRAALKLPAGFRVAERETSLSGLTRAPASAPVRVSPVSPGRIRTRSS